MFFGHTTGSTISNQVAYKKLTLITLILTVGSSNGTAWLCFLRSCANLLRSKSANGRPSAVISSRTRNPPSQSLFLSAHQKYLRLWNYLRTCQNLNPNPLASCRLILYSVIFINKNSRYLFGVLLDAGCSLLSHHNLIEEVVMTSHAMSCIQ